MSLPFPQNPTIPTNHANPTHSTTTSITRRTLSAPFAGLYYWNNAPKEDEVRVRLQTTDDEQETEVTVQAPKEKLEIFMRTMNYNEKGMVRVKGILPDQYI